MKERERDEERKEIPWTYHLLMTSYMSGPMLELYTYSLIHLFSQCFQTAGPVQFSCSVVSNSLRPHGFQHARLPCPWDPPGKNTGVGCHFLLQGIFPTQESNPCLLCLLHWHVGSLPLSHLGSPFCKAKELRLSKEGF